MQAINHKYDKISKVLDTVGDGILVLHQKYSGTFLMLKNYIDSFSRDYENEQRLEGISFCSIDDEHTLFNELVATYQIKNSNALMVIRNGAVINVLNGPLYKNELQKQLNSLFNKTSPFDAELDYQYIFSNSG